MSTTIVNFFTSGQYEEIVKETSAFLRRVPANPTAVHLKSLAHYQLGEYEPCIRLLERAIVYLVGREPLQMRLQLAGLLANAMLEQGRYEDVRDLVEHSVPEGAAVREEYGELLLASAWSAYFEGLFQLSDHATTRIFDISGDHFTCGRAALCAALTARRSGEPLRGKAYLIKAQHHLTQAQNLCGNPSQVRGLFLLQAQIARRGTSDGLDALTEETAHLPKGSKCASLLRLAVVLFRGFLAKEPIAADVSAAVARGVKRPWVALLPGAQARTRAAEEGEPEAERGSDGAKGRESARAEPKPLPSPPAESVVEIVEIPAAPAAEEDAPVAEMPPPLMEDLPVPEEAPAEPAPAAEAPVIEEAAPAEEFPAALEMVPLVEEAPPVEEFPVALEMIPLVEDAPPVEPVPAEAPGLVEEPLALDPAAAEEILVLEELPEADGSGWMEEMILLEIPPEDEAPLVIEAPVVMAALMDLEAFSAMEAAAEQVSPTEPEPEILETEPEILETEPEILEAEPEILELEPTPPPLPAVKETLAPPPKPTTEVVRVFDVPAPIRLSEEPQPSSGSGVIRDLHEMPHLKESPTLDEIFDPEGLSGAPAAPKPPAAKAPPPVKAAPPSLPRTPVPVKAPVPVPVRAPVPVSVKAPVPVKVPQAAPPARTFPAVPVSLPMGSAARKPPTSVTLPAPKRPTAAPAPKKPAQADEDIPIAEPVTRGGMGIAQRDVLSERLQQMQVRSREDATRIRRKNAQGAILLVEPTERVAKSVEDCLRDSNFRIAKRVEDIDAALEQYVLLRPSLVLVNLGSPGVSGVGPAGTPAFVRMFLELDPLCKIAVLFTTQTKAMVVEAVRQGARAGIEIPLSRPEVLDALGKALTARSANEALRVPTLELKRPVACSWKAVESGVRGLLGSWQSFVARSLDPMGLEANLTAALKVGSMIRLNIEIPGAEKTVQTLAEVTSSKREPALNHHVTRFTFVKLPPDARDRLVEFLMEAMNKAPKGR